MTTGHILRRIAASHDFTALEKRYLEELIERDTAAPPPPCDRCRHLIDTGDYTYCDRLGVCIPDEVPR